MQQISLFNSEGGKREKSSEYNQIFILTLKQQKSFAFCKSPREPIVSISKLNALSKFICV
jgi:hypothetical protein